MSTKTTDEVYQDRNALALALAAILDDYYLVPKNEYRRLLAPPLALTFPAGWHPPTDEDDADADEWAVIVAELPTGQVSWHVPRSLVEDSTLSEYFTEWDGHNRKEKNDRLRRLSEPDKNR